MSDKKFASIRPSPLASIVGIVGGIAMFVLGIAFVVSVPAGPGPAGFAGIFFLVWFLVCGGIVIYYGRNLASYSKKEKDGVPLTASEVVEMEQDEAGAMDFAARLRKLEALRRDHLVSQEEFLLKRKEIMDEKW
jgi:hypothetical protein